MKNMKKILAVGALLTLGTMAIGNGTSEDFNINLKVISPLKIDAGDAIINFDDTMLSQIADTEAIKEFTVTGAKNLNIGINIDTDNKLSNAAGVEIPYTAFIGQDNANSEVTRTLTDGNVTEDLKIVLGNPTDIETKDALGDYTGALTMRVDYN